MKKIRIEKTGYLKWMWGDRDHGPIISTEELHFDPDQAFHEFSGGSEVLSDYVPKKVKVIITIQEIKE